MEEKTYKLLGGSGAVAVRSLLGAGIGHPGSATREAFSSSHVRLPSFIRGRRFFGSFAVARRTGAPACI